MNYEKIIPEVLKNEVNRNPKGYFSRLRLTHKRILKWIFDHTSNIDSNATIGERTYWIINHLTEYPLCEECHIKPKKFYGVINGYGRFCSLQCTGKNEGKIQRSLQTSIKHFGKDNINNRNKAKQTCKDLYGEEFFVNTQDFKNGLQKFLDDNNVSNTAQICELMQKSICTKRRKYGNKFEKITEKQKKTVANFTKEKRQQIQNKRKKTCKKIYGVEYSSQCSNVKQKVKNTFRKNYGVDNPMQSAEFRQKILGRKYIYDNKSFDSSDELALYIWMVDHKLAFEFQPNVGFEYQFNGKKKMYFPDFKIGDKCFEIKGDHFFKEDGTMQNPYDHSQDSLYEAKHQCMLKNHVIIILTSSAFIKRIRQYVNNKYGKKYLKQFKCKTNTI